MLLAIQAVGGGVDTRRYAPGVRKRAALLEQNLQQVHRVSEVDGSSVVRVSGVQTARYGAGVEEVTEDAKSVRDLGDAI